MILDLKDVLASEQKIEEKQLKLEKDVIAFGGQNFPVLEKSPARFTLTARGRGRAKIAGRARVVLGMACDRCLEETGYEFLLEFERDVIAPDVEKRPQEKEDDSLLCGYQWDADDLICNEIYVNWPMKVLCRPACRGICEKCGKNRNDGECGCDTFVPDPRMAVIKDIFNADKEV